MGSSLSSYVPNSFKKTNTILPQTASVNINPVNPDDVNPSSGTQSPQDISITNYVQPRSLAVAAGAFGLLANPPKLPTTYFFQYRIYLLSLLFSFLPCIALVYIPAESSGNQRVSWLHKQVMRIAMVSIAISVLMRIYLELPPPIKWYDVVVLILAVSSTGLYLWYGGMTATKSGQTSGAGLASANEV